ncbi:protein GVQW3 [Trichonephila clavipes]|nr:protein GVQW3 [Trichonephila clavipes]
MSIARKFIEVIGEDIFASKMKRLEISLEEDNFFRATTSQSSNNSRSTELNLSNFSRLAADAQQYTGKPYSTPVGSIAALSELVKLYSPEKCRINIKFLVKLKKSATETFQILIETYGDETLSREHVFEWYKRFSGGRVSGEDDEPAGRPRSAITDKNIAKICEMGGFPLTSVIRLLINTLDFYKDREKMRGKWLLHQNNASAHMALSVKQFLTSRNIIVMGHPPYSPNLTSCDFFKFPTVITYLKGTHFTSVEEVQAKTENLVKGLLKTSFENCHQQ